MVWYVIIFLVTLFFLLPMAIAWGSFAPWVPTRKSDLERIFALAELKEDEIFYDLGCGDGRLVIHASQNFKAKSVGLEIGLPFFIVSWLKAFTLGDGRVVIKWKNLFKEDLTNADVIYLFGTVDTLGEEFQNKLQTETKTGTRVISYAFPVGTLIPEQVSKRSVNELPIYVYRF